MNKQKKQKNAAVMKALKSIHSLKDNADLDKQRKTQEVIGLLLSNNKRIIYEQFKIGNLACEWITNPKINNLDNVILYFHGGGYVSGNLSYGRILGAKLCSSCEVNVLSVEYRLAPEFSYPSQLEDALKAWEFLIKKGYSSKNIAVAGESAGGNLTLSLAVYLSQNNMDMPNSLVCMSPWTDLTAKSKTYITKKSLDPILTHDFLNSAAYAYALDTPLNNPLISPVYADFKNFPPTMIQVGTNEILLGDSLTLHKRLKNAGVNSRIEIWNGMWHVFQMFPIPKANRAIQNIALFLTDNLFKKLSNKSEECI